MLTTSYTPLSLIPQLPLIPVLPLIYPCVSQKSMSGISVHDQCINAFFHMKKKSAVSKMGMYRGR